MSPIARELVALLVLEHVVEAPGVARTENHLVAVRADARLSGPPALHAREGSCLDGVHDRCEQGLNCFGEVWSDVGRQRRKLPAHNELLVASPNGSHFAQATEASQGVLQLLDERPPAWRNVLRLPASRRCRSFVRLFDVVHICTARQLDQPRATSAVVWCRQTGAEGSGGVAEVASGTQSGLATELVVPTRNTARPDSFVGAVDVRPASAVEMGVDAVMVVVEVPGQVLADLRVTARTAHGEGPNTVAARPEGGGARGPELPGVCRRTAPVFRLRGSVDSSAGPMILDVACCFRRWQLVCGASRPPVEHLFPRLELEPCLS